MGAWDVRVSVAMAAKRVGGGASRLSNMNKKGQVTRRTIRALNIGSSMGYTVGGQSHTVTHTATCPANTTLACR